VQIEELIWNYSTLYFCETV